MNTKILHDMSINDYHAHEAISRSNIVDALNSKTPAHYHAEINAERDETALKFGNAFHSYILEPHIYEACAVLYTGKNKTANTLDFKKQEESLSSSEFLVHPSWEEKFVNMAKAINNHAPARDLLSKNGDIETSFFWEEPHPYKEGEIVKLKCRPDFFADNIVIDLKKTNNIKTSAHQDDFAKSAANYGYFLQAYITMRGIGIVTGTIPNSFKIIAVEDAEPYGVNVMNISDEGIEAGELAFNVGLKKLLKYRESNDCYPEEEQVLSPPEWYINKLYMEAASDE